MNEPDQNTTPSQPQDAEECCGGCGGGCNASEPASGHRECQEKIRQYEAGWKRALADYQNLQRETQQQKKELVQWCTAQLLTELIPLADHFDEAILHAPADSNAGWLSGITHIRRELEELFSRHGVTPFGAVGDRFNPSEHEALEQQEGPPESDHTIARVVAKGYRSSERVIRPAKVIIFTQNDKQPQ